MGKALWVSRHPLDPLAEAELRKLFMIDGVNSVDFSFSEDSEKAFGEFLELVKDYGVVGGVFPAQLWFALLRNNTSLQGKVLFLVVSKVLPIENGVRKFAYDHIEWLKF